MGLYRLIQTLQTHTDSLYIILYFKIFLLLLYYIMMKKTQMKNVRMTKN